MHTRVDPMEAIIFTGIPGSGKSTFYKQNFFNSHLRINLDMLRTRRRESILLHACLQAGQRFVVDNTNVTADERAQYIGFAREARFQVTGYIFESNMGDCIRRNSERMGKARVPDSAIAAMSRRLQIPSYAEGYSTLYYVKIVETGGFEVVELRNDV